jgi:uncharacterized membrane protein
VQKFKTLKMVALIAVFSAPLLLATPVLAADGDVAKTQNFLNEIIKIAAQFAGAIATLFIVIGGFGYATSSGNPEKMDKSKNTIIMAAIGLAIVIAAYVISGIVTDIASNSFGK